MFAESRRVLGGLGGEEAIHGLVKVVAGLSSQARHDCCIGGVSCRFRSV
jgi:hypothetical protein